MRLAWVQVRLYAKSADTPILRKVVAEIVEYIYMVNRERQLNDKKDP